MVKSLAALFLLAVRLPAQPKPPEILYIYRDRLLPGSSAGGYRQIEQDAARICLELQCPHPYLGIESLTGPKEVWWLNGFHSAAEQKQVAAAYAANAPLTAALNEIVKRKQGLTLEPVEGNTIYRAGLSRGAPWSPGHGRFLVITMIWSDRKIDGTVFEFADGTRFIITAANTQPEAARKAAAAGPDTNIFAVRPYWSMPAKEWIAADPEFWKVSSASGAK